jgi:hypothetical protein
MKAVAKVDDDLLSMKMKKALGKSQLYSYSLYIIIVKILY